MLPTRYTTLLLLLLPATTTLACLNDRETINTEAEFRSRYESPANPGAALAPQLTPDSEALPSSTQWNPAGVALFAVGLLLFTAATRITYRKLSAQENKQ